MPGTPVPGAAPGVPAAGILGFFANGSIDSNTTGWIHGTQAERDEALARGKKPKDLGKEIEEKLKGVLVTPVVTVSVEQLAQVSVSVVGQVRNAGAFNMEPGSSVLQALASACVLGLGGWLVIERQLTLGQLVAAELIVTAVVTATAVAPTGNVTITGFPIVAAGILIAGGGVFIQQNINVAAGYTQVEGQILSGNTFMSIIRSGDNVAPAVVQGGELNATFDFQFWGVYRV